MKNIMTISQIDLNLIRFAILKIDEIRNNINSENQENKNKEDLVTSILDIEEVLNMTVDSLRKVISEE